MTDATKEERIPASTELSGKAAGKKVRPIPPPLKAIAWGGIGVLGLIIFVAISAGVGSFIDSRAAHSGADTTQGFGICDDGGSADEASLAVDMDELTTFAAMKAWAPELELTNQQIQLGRYTMVGRAQLDKCRILALVDNATGEYYAFVFMLDEQGSYIVGMSRANLNEAPENLPDKMPSRPRQ